MNHIVVPSSARIHALLFDLDGTPTTLAWRIYLARAEAVEQSPVSHPPPARRSPLVALILSGLFPGLGQLYNRQRWKALLFLAAGILTAFGPSGPADLDIDPG